MYPFPETFFHSIDSAHELLYHRQHRVSDLLGHCCKFVHVHDLEYAFRLYSVRSVLGDDPQAPLYACKRSLELKVILCACLIGPDIRRFRGGKYMAKHNGVGD